MCKACQPIRSHFSCKTSQELEFFALFNAVHSIELMSRGYAIEYTVCRVGASFRVRHKLRLRILDTPRCRGMNMGSRAKGGAPHSPMNRFPVLESVAVQKPDREQWRVEDFPELGAPTLGGGRGTNIRFCQIFPQTA